MPILRPFVHGPFSTFLAAVKSSSSRPCELTRRFWEKKRDTSNAELRRPYNAAAPIQKWASENNTAMQVPRKKERDGETYKMIKPPSSPRKCQRSSENNTPPPHGLRGKDERYIVPSNYWSKLSRYRAGSADNGWSCLLQQLCIDLEAFVGLEQDLDMITLI